LFFESGRKKGDAPSGVSTRPKGSGYLQQKKTDQISKSWEIRLLEAKAIKRIGGRRVTHKIGTRIGQKIGTEVLPQKKRAFNVVTMGATGQDAGRLSGQIKSSEKFQPSKDEKGPNAW